MNRRKLISWKFPFSLRSQNPLGISRRDDFGQRDVSLKQCLVSLASYWLYCRVYQLNSYLINEVNICMIHKLNDFYCQLLKINRTTPDSQLTKLDFPKKRLHDGSLGSVDSTESQQKLVGRMHVLDGKVTYQYPHRLSKKK